MTNLPVGTTVKAAFALAVMLVSCSPHAEENSFAWEEYPEAHNWTKAAAEAVLNSDLPILLPSDVSTFCANYANLTEAYRVHFWASLLSAMARWESAFDPNATYQERFHDGRGKPVISRGLMQLSIESSNQPRYSCGIDQPVDLHDAQVNLQCAVRILSYWVGKDGRIAGSQQRSNRGGGRYWSVLRADREKLPWIQQFTANQPLCSGQLLASRH